MLASLTAWCGESIEALSIETLNPDKHITKKYYFTAISWAAAVSWMLLIYYLSAQTAAESLESSYSFTDKILHIVNILLPGQEINIAAFDDFIRSAAHFAIYMILGLLIANAFFFQCIYYNTDEMRRYYNAKDVKDNGNENRKNRYIWVLLISFIICLMYAISDEIHQIFVPGRGAQISDVLLDSLGAGTGIIIYWQLGKLLFKRNSRLSS